MIDTKAGSSTGHVFLTGVTGFVGKVVLETLLRRKEEFHLEQVYVLIRPKKEMSALERFQKMKTSPCFQHLPEAWEEYVTVVSGELTHPTLGMSPEFRQKLTGSLTEIINCAASVEFDLPLAEAAQSNIVSALNVLELARESDSLQRFVNVSTAYVSPHPGAGKVIEEALVELPFDPEKTFQDILSGKADQAALMAQSGHPNTYTLTKCLSEHLLSLRQGDVPLAIVRPSIISASWQFPEPGWIDSYAAFAGFVSLIGAGLLRSVVADQETTLDLIPCDEVANSIVRTAFWQEGAPPAIQHIVSGLTLGARIGDCIAGIETYFQENPTHKWAKMRQISNGSSIRISHWREHVLPNRLAALFCSLTGKTKQKMQLDKLLSKIEYLNTAFPYFTHHSFDFQSLTPFEPEGYSPEAYVTLTCDGVYRNLMRKDPSETAFGGAAHRHPLKDWAWIKGQAKGNAAIRLASYIVRKGLRKSNDLITFDKGSFEQAARKINPQALPVVIPTHRSYMDFILCSFLFFAHPELKVSIPHIAAANEFARLPFLGWFFKQTHAFYIQRGKGKEDPELTRKIQELVDQNQTLEFFIEGTRSRSRRFLKPKRGLMRALQKTEIPIQILPIALSYDLVPEVSSFLRELKGGAKPRTRMSALLKWLLALAQGKVNLGRVHLKCGQPIELGSDSDVYQASAAVMAELQKSTVVSTFHLNAFVSKHPSIDLAQLRSALEKRGAHIVESTLESPVSALHEMTFRYHWIHYFYPDLLKMKPNDSLLQHHIEENAHASIWKEAAAEWDDNPMLPGLLEAISTPISAACSQLLNWVDDHSGAFDLNDILADLPGLFKPYLEDALSLCLKMEILKPEGTRYKVGPNWEQRHSLVSQSKSKSKGVLTGALE